MFCKRANGDDSRADQWICPCDNTKLRSCDWMLFFVCLLHHGRPLSFLLKNSRIYIVQVPKDSCMMFGAGGSQATLPLRFEKFRSNKKTESKASFAASMFRLKWDAVDSCHVQVPLTFSVGKVTMIFSPFERTQGRHKAGQRWFFFSFERTQGRHNAGQHIFFLFLLFWKLC